MASTIEPAAEPESEPAPVAEPESEPAPESKPASSKNLPTAFASPPEWPALTQPKYPIRTARLLLRPVTLADLVDVNSYRSIPEVAEYLPHTPHSMEDTERTLNRMIATEKMAEPGSWLDFAVEISEAPEASNAGSQANLPKVVGEVLLKWDKDEPRNGEVGYAFHPGVHGTGIPTEAVAAALKVGFENFNWHRIHGICDVLNERSAALMMRLGMRKEAELREVQFGKGRWYTFCHYAILQSEWQKANQTN